MEERLKLCREFWNDYKTFVDWLNDNESALNKAVAGSQSGVELSKIKVRHFQVNVLTDGWTTVVFSGWLANDLFQHSVCLTVAFK